MLKIPIRLDISCELSAGRQFTWYIEPYFTPKIKKRYHKLVDCCCWNLRFKSKNHVLPIIQRLLIPETKVGQILFSRQCWNYWYLLALPQLWSFYNAFSFPYVLNSLNSELPKRLWVFVHSKYIYGKAKSHAYLELWNSCKRSFDVHLFF